MGGQRQVAILREPDVIAARYFHAIALRHAQIRHEEAGNRPAIGPQRQARQRQDARPEQFQIGACKTDTLFVGVVDHPFCGDPPARFLGATLGRHHVAPAVGGIFQRDRAVVFAHAAIGGQPAALAQRQQQIVHRPGFELVGQLDAFGKQLIAVLVHEADASVGDDLARILVPGDRIGAQRTVAAAQHDVATGRNDVAFRTVFENVRLEPDLAFAGGIDAIRTGGRRRCVEAGIGFGYRQQLVDIFRCIDSGLLAARLALRVFDRADIVRRGLGCKRCRCAQDQRCRRQCHWTNGHPAGSFG